MSLEAPGYIKDLIATNPEGTDPKSQGDDHLRLIKQCLQSQFSGFTEGLAIRLLESEINDLGGKGIDVGITNIDTATPHSCIFGAVTGLAGTKPPGWAVGDMVLHLAFDANTMVQLFLAKTTLVYLRWRSGGAWGTWRCLNATGFAQIWQVLTGSRALGTSYTNTTPQPIMVSVTCLSGNSVNPGFIEAQVSGAIIARSAVLEYSGATWQGMLNCLTFIVPAGATYAVLGASPIQLHIWSELR